MSVCGQSITPAYVVTFTDKPAYTARVPVHTFLSPRSMEHRLQYNIPVIFEDYPISQDYIQNILNIDSSIVLISQSKWFNYIVIRSLHELLDTITQLPFVSHIFDVYGVDYEVFLKGKEFGYFPSLPQAPDISLDKMVSGSEYYGWMYDQINMHKGQLLHDLGYRAEGILVAVIDGGFAGLDTCRYFARLREQQYLGCYDFVNEPYSPYQSETHGTSVFSVMSSDMEGYAVGTAPMANYVALKSEAVGYEDILEEFFLVAAAECADSLGADVANISLGYTQFDNGQSHVFSDLDGRHSLASMAVALLVKKNCVTVVAAGNSGANAWHYISIPSDSPNALCVAAIGIDKKIAPFSSRGSLFLPFHKPDIAAVGYGTAVFNPRISDIQQSGGTSFAAPVISGLTACLRQAFPARTSFEIIAAIRQSGHQPTQPDTLTGYGIPDFVQAYRILSALQNAKTPFGNYEIRAFPNPTHDKTGVILLRMVDGENYRIQLADMTGRILENKYLENNTTVFDLSGYAQGIYLLRVMIKNVLVSESKIMKY